MVGRALALASLLGGCSRPEAASSASDTSTYTLRDTAAYANEVSGGDYAVLLRNGKVVDSIDLFFGLQRLNTGTAVFLPVESYADEVIVEEGVAAMFTTRHVLDHGKRRDTLASMLPDFDDHFSSPSVLGGVLYYWGLKKTPEGGYVLHAVRYDALTGSIAARPLFESQLETDNRGHLAPPTNDAGTILFETFGRAFRVSRDWKRVEETTPRRYIPTP